MKRSDKYGKNWIGVYIAGVVILIVVVSGGYFYYWYY